MQRSGTGDLDDVDDSRLLPPVSVSSSTGRTLRGFHEVMTGEFRVAKCVKHDFPRTGTGRFNVEELSCFKRVPTPVNWSLSPRSPLTTPHGSMPMSGRRSASDPVLRGSPTSMRSFSSSRGMMMAWAEEDDPPTQPPSTSGERQGTMLLTSKLPDEDMTETVLKRIFPLTASPPRSAGGDGGRHRNPRRATVRGPPGRLQEHALGTTSGELQVKKVPSTPGSRKAQFSTSQRLQIPSVDQGDVSDDKHEDASPARVHGKSRLIAFRQRLLVKFQTVKSAFEIFASETSQGMERELTRKQFARFLENHFPTMNRSDHNHVFDFLDSDHNGLVSIEEFQSAVEAAAPIRNMEDVRRRWIALGYGTMRNALTKVAGALPYGADPGRKIAFKELCIALSATGVEDDEEHQVVFNAIHDPSDSSNMVTMEMLAAAISAVSPSFLLEDIRERLLRRFNSIWEAFDAMQVDRGLTPLSRGDFAKYAIDHFRMTAYEAYKAFELMDVDCNRTVSRREFVSALTLSEPSLPLEEVRRKVRQRFHSISNVFSKKSEDEDDQDRGFSRGVSRGGGMDEMLGTPAPGAGVASDGSPKRGSVTGGSPRRRAKSSIFQEKPEIHMDAEAFHKGSTSLATLEKQTPYQFHSLLQKVELTENDTEILFTLVDINKDGRLTLTEFTRAIRLFTPSCVLEDLRVACLKDHRTVSAAFARVPHDKRDSLMDEKGLEALLTSLGLTAFSLQIQAIHRVVETRREGGITVSDLISALQCSGTGSRVALSSEQRDAMARQAIQNTMAPFRKSATELRSLVREQPETPLRQSLHTPKSQSSRSLPRAPGSAENAPLPRGKKNAVIPHRPTKISFRKVSSYIKGQCLDHTHDSVKGYYVSTGHSMVVADEIFHERLSRIDHHRNTARHHKFLAKDAPVL